MNIKIGNAQAFWGDRMEAAAELLQQQPDLDYLTLDYLSEVSLSIMAVQQEKDPQTGYARDFIDVIKSVIPFWKKGYKVKIIANAGGLNPKNCAEACVKTLNKHNCNHLKVGIVYGDDVANIIKNDPLNPIYNNLETKEPINIILNKLTTANAYLGAKSIVEALNQGANIVITGRMADPSLTVAPCVAHFGWQWTDYHKIAQATVAGHLIECGTQVTGGISTDWLTIPDTDLIGFPFVEIDEDGNFVVTKPEKSGGLVNVDTIKEQLLYEIGDPTAYMSPDAIVSFLSLRLEQVGKNRVSVSGALGKAPPGTYKVSATYRDGYRAEGMLAIFGRHSKEKAHRCGKIIAASMKKADLKPAKYRMECLGCGDIVPGVMPFEDEAKSSSTPLECILRVCAMDERKEVLEYFSKQIAQLVTCGPQGTTGYTSGRPHIRPVYGYWPCLIETQKVKPVVEIFEVLNE
jgi:hypothetical protein